MARSTGVGFGDGVRRVCIDPRVWVLVGCYAFLLVTNSRVAAPVADDSIDYRIISASAPGLPVHNGALGSAYSGRFAIHYLVGLLSHFGGLSLDASYDIVFAVLVMVLLAVVYALFRTLSVKDFAICAALFLLNPYTTRIYILQTTLVEAAVFFIGLGLCLLGLRNRSVAAVLVGLAVAVIGRQTAIMVAPIAAIWILVEPGWRSTYCRRRLWSTALAALGITFGLYLGIKVWTSTFSGRLEPSPIHNTILNLVPGLPGSLSQLAAHLARSAMPLVVSTAVFVALAIIVGWKNIGPATWGSIAIAAAISVQPVITDPNWTGFAFNEQRLDALAVLPIVAAVADLLSRTGYRNDKPLYPVAIFTLIAVASL